MKNKKNNRSRAVKVCTLGLAATLALVSLSTTAHEDQDANHASDPPKPENNTVIGSNNSTEIPQVTITAQRRATLLKDTPVSVQAISAQQLDNEGIRNIDDLTRIMPGVNFSRSGTSATGNYNDEDSEIAVRGISSSAGASTTGVYIDDTPIQTRHLSFGSVAPFPALFDLDRVEMLRGPQGTLFGAGSEGGAVRFIQPEPTLDEQSVYAHSELASTKKGAPSYDVGVALGQALVTDVAGFRLSVSSRRDGGFVDRVSVDPVTNLANGTVESNANWQQTTTARAAVKFVPSRDTSIIASVYHQELKLNDTGAYWEQLSNPSHGILLNGNAQANSSRDPFTLWALKVNSDLGWSRLTSSTSYFTRDQTGVSDYTQFLGTLLLNNPYAGGPNGAGGTGSASFTDTQHNVIEELKLQSSDPKARLTWVAGLFLSRSDENTTEVMSDPAVMNAGLLPAVAGVPAGVLVNSSPYEAIEKQLAVFGQSDLSLTDTVKLTLGLRVAQINTTGHEYFIGPLVGPVASSVSNAIKETPVTPKFGLSWQPEADDLLYVSAAKGYRTGGINPNLGTLCAADLQTLGLTSAPETYKSDSLWSYEIGSKNSFLSRSLQIDSSLFYVDWKNIQQSVYLSNCGNQFAANLGSAISKGGDASIRFKPTPNWMLTADIAYTDARFNETVTVGAGQPIVSKGDYLSTNPWNFTFAADYKVPGFEDMKPYLHADYQLNTHQVGLTPAQNLNNGGSDPNAIDAPGTKILALRAGARWNGWDGSLFINNALNSLPELVHQHDTNASTLYFDRTWRPSTIGLTINYRY